MPPLTPTSRTTSHHAISRRVGFSDTTRLAVLLLLAERGELRVTDLVQELGGSQANISAHVACLKDCGLLADRPDGRQTFYRISSEQVFDFLAAADRLLADTGADVAICPHYSNSGR